MRFPWMWVSTISGDQQQEAKDSGSSPATGPTLTRIESERQARSGGDCVIGHRRMRLEDSASKPKGPINGPAGGRLVRGHDCAGGPTGQLCPPDPSPASRAQRNPSQFMDVFGSVPLR